MSLPVRTPDVGGMYLTLANMREQAKARQMQMEEAEKQREMQKQQQMFQQQMAQQQMEAQASQLALENELKQQAVAREQAEKARAASVPMLSMLTGIFGRDEAPLLAAKPMRRGF